MKYLILLFVCLSSFPAFSQDCKLLFDEKKQESMLVGICSRAALIDTPFVSWYNKSFDIYMLDTNTLSKINKDFSELTITIVMGTWCGDSREFVPAFFKMIDKINFPESQIKLIMVDRKRQGLSNETEMLNIEKVPTFIFYKNGNEIGRIIETPQKSLEKDFLKITGE